MSGTFNGKQYKIVNSVGHIFQLANPEEQVAPELQDKYKSWKLEYLPWNQDDLAWKKKLASDFKDTYKTIKEAVDQADEIVIATDDDPTGEGTLLADEILMAIKPRNKHYYRSFHVDESVKEIQKAMSNLKDLGTNPLNDPDYIKANFRSRWDYMSMQWTRVFTRFGDGKSVLRQGRLKSYMVWAVGEQIRKINEYKKIPFYENRFVDENENTYSSKDEPQYPEKSEVPNVYRASTVQVDKKEIKYSSPPALYDLNLLSASLAVKGYTSKQVLNIYQKMYEDHIVSYPRTEDKTITPEQFNEFLQIADKVATAVNVDTSLLTHRTPRKTHVVAQGSHGANRPATNVPKSLTQLKEKYGQCGADIYEFIARNSLAMLCEDYEYEHQTGHIVDYPSFVGYANIPLKQGYRQIFNDKKGEKENKPLGTTAKPFIYEGFPPKPTWPTAKWLAELLKKNDVGTGATRASIYGDITNQNTKYPLLMQDKKGKITMARCGELSYALLKDTHIGDVKLTEQLQEQMRLVASGADPKKFIDEISTYIMQDMQIVERNAKTINLELTKSVQDTSLTCPNCGAKLKHFSWGYVCPNHSNDDSSKCSFILGYNAFGGNLKDEHIKQIVENGKTEKPLSLTSKAGKKYKAYIKYENGELGLKFVNSRRRKND